MALAAVLSPAAAGADFEGSLAWAEFIDQPELREQTTKEVIAGWVEYRPEEAAAYFQTTATDAPSRSLFEKLNQETTE